MALDFEHIRRFFETQGVGLFELRAEVKARHEVVAPNYRRVWNLELGWRKNLLRDQPLFLRASKRSATSFSRRKSASCFANCA